jgi:hypothetical protein
MLSVFFSKIAQEIKSQTCFSEIGYGQLMPLLSSKFLKHCSAAECFFQEATLKETLISILVSSAIFLGEKGL